MVQARLLLIAAGLAGLVACGGGNGGATTGSPTAPAPAPTPLPTPAAAVARYRVTFESTWSRESHPVDFPNDAHFSPLIGGTHSSQARFWMPGGLATPGIQAMAERGRVSPLDTEVQAAIAAGTAFSVIRGGAIDRSPGT